MQKWILMDHDYIREILRTSLSIKMQIPMLFLCHLNNNFERLRFVIFGFFLISEDPHATLPPIPQIRNRKIQNPRVWRIWEDRFFFSKNFWRPKNESFFDEKTRPVFIWFLCKFWKLHFLKRKIARVSIKNSFSDF